MIGREDRLPHTLVPLALAVSLVRAKLSSDASPAGRDPNAMATFMAATVPIWEYSDDPSRPPRPLRASSRNGVFRDGGRELRYLDGRPTKALLAVHVDDIECVVRMLEHPDRALHIRNKILRKLSAILVERSRTLEAQSLGLRRAAQRILGRLSGG